MSAFNTSKHCEDAITYLKKSSRRFQDICYPVHIDYVVTAEKRGQLDIFNDVWSTSKKVLFCNHPHSLCKSPLSCFLPHFFTETVRKTSEAQLGKTRCVQYYRCWLSCVTIYNVTICSFVKKLLCPELFTHPEKVYTLQCSGCDTACLNHSMSRHRQQSIKRVYVYSKCTKHQRWDWVEVNSMECP